MQSVEVKYNFSNRHGGFRFCTPGCRIVTSQQRMGQSEHKCGTVRPPQGTKRVFLCFTGIATHIEDFARNYAAETRELHHALSVLRRYQQSGKGLPPRRRSRGYPAAAPVPCLRRTLHDIRACPTAGTNGPKEEWPTRTA